MDVAATEYGSGFVGERGYDSVVHVAVQRASLRHNSCWMMMTSVYLTLMLHVTVKCGYRVR